MWLPRDSLTLLPSVLEAVKARLAVLDDQNWGIPRVLPLLPYEEDFYLGGWPSGHFTCILVPLAQ